MDPNDLMKELLKQLLTDNLEIEIRQDSDRRTWVSLKLFGEVISSDFIYT